jgi:mono/diheme cytochrome c family protein
MLKLGLIVAALVFCANTAWVRQEPTASQAASSAAHVVSSTQTQQGSPVKPTPESAARAKMIYGYDCAVCHGAKGDGKGDLAKDMALTMPDFTDPASLKSKTDGELVDSIKDGKGKMPPEGDRAKTEELRGLVFYCRSFAQKTVPAQGTTAK